VTGALATLRRDARRRLGHAPHAAAGLLLAARGPVLVAGRERVDACRLGRVVGRASSTSASIAPASAASSSRRSSASGTTRASPSGERQRDAVVEDVVGDDLLLAPGGDEDLPLLGKRLRLCT
jgi:hypothetical protein